MSIPVLIVDDDPGILKTAGYVLSRRGYSVTEAPSGEHCLEALRAGFRGVILMDIMMPGLTGWETIRTALSEQLLGEHHLICMLTARPEPGPESEGLETCIFDYLAKPFDSEQLLGMVANAGDILTP